MNKVNNVDIDFEAEDYENIDYLRELFNSLLREVVTELNNIVKGQDQEKSINGLYTARTLLDRAIAYKEDWERKDLIN